MYVSRYATYVSRCAKYVSTCATCVSRCATCVSRCATYVSRCATCVSRCSIPLSMSSSLQVELVSPNSGPIGSLVEIAGNFPGSASLYERLYLGDLQCNHINNETNLPYRIRWSSPYRYVRCLVEKREAGSYNASVLFNDWRGLSWNHSQAMYLMHDGALAMYELFPGRCMCVSGNVMSGRVSEWKSECVISE